MTRLRLVPVPHLDLPPWSDRTRRAWEMQANRVTELSAKAGAGRNFAQLVAEARALLLAGDRVALDRRLADRRFMRAVVTAWRDDVALARSTMSPEMIRSLAAGSRPSRLTTIASAALFFTHFDRLEGWQHGLFGAVRDLVRGAVAGLPSRHTSDLIETIRHHDGLLLELDGPNRLAQGLLATGENVTSWFRANHLTVHTDSRLGRIARDAYYLTSIERADAENGDHEFLEDVTAEVLTRQRTESTDDDYLRFGHQVLNALTSKTTRHPSQGWLRAVLEIGGDPRTRQTRKWQTWWSPVPTENRDRAVRWMRGVELRAFLDGVESYAEEHDEDMLRMLARRKQLLLGLYDQDRVSDVRLVLGDSIREDVRRRTTSSLHDGARLQSRNKADTAVIYLDCGDFWLVEGSHSFKLQVYTGGAVDELADRRLTAFSHSELRKTLPLRNAQIYGEDMQLIVAHQGFEWLVKVLNFLAYHGITVDERGLMTANDYALLQRRRENERYGSWA